MAARAGSTTIIFYRWPRAGQMCQRIFLHYARAAIGESILRTGRRDVRSPRLGLGAVVCVDKIKCARDANTGVGVSVSVGLRWRRYFIPFHVDKFVSEM